MTALAAALTAVQASWVHPPHRTGATGGPPAATPAGQDDYLRRLGKIEGQVRGLQR